MYSPTAINFGNPESVQSTASRAFRMAGLASELLNDLPQPAASDDNVLKVSALIYAVRDILYQLSGEYAQK